MQVATIDPSAVIGKLSDRNRLPAKQASKSGGSQTRPLNFYGNNAHFQTIYTDKILAGPADTGKTMSTLYQLHQWCLQYPGFQAGLIRKTYKSIPGSACQSYENKILPKGHNIAIYGGKRPERYIYPNGSTIWVAGMDNPDRVLSSERDAILVVQAEELTKDEWEVLTTRANGRAGNAPFALVYGDCNPGNQYHWILEKKNEGSIEFVESRHTDNPELYNQETGEITEAGKMRIGKLDKLTGLRHKRLRLGLWVAAEGQVYEFDPEIHVISANKVPNFIARYRVIDFGFTNPFVCQWWGEDSDGRLYMYREIYMTGRTVRKHHRQIHDLSKGERFAATISDHDAEDRATLIETWKDEEDNERVEGIYTIPAKKTITTGIEKVQERLKKAGDGKPRLFIVSDALVEVDQRLKEDYKPICTEQEFPGYVYPQKKDGRNADENPIKEDDHGMDGVRYIIMHLDGNGPAKPIPPQPEQESRWSQFGGQDATAGGRWKKF